MAPRQNLPSVGGVSLVRQGTGLIIVVALFAVASIVRIGPSLEEPHPPTTPGSHRSEPANADINFKAIPEAKPALRARSPAIRTRSGFAARSCLIEQPAASEVLKRCGCSLGTVGSPQWKARIGEIPVEPLLSPHGTTPVIVGGLGNSGTRGIRDLVQAAAAEEGGAVLTPNGWLRLAKHEKKTHVTQLTNFAGDSELLMGLATPEVPGRDELIKWAMEVGVTSSQSFVFDQASVDGAAAKARREGSTVRRAGAHFFNNLPSPWNATVNWLRLVMCATLEATQRLCHHERAELGLLKEGSGSTAPAPLEPFHTASNGSVLLPVLTGRLAERSEVRAAMVGALPRLWGLKHPRSAMLLPYLLDVFRSDQDWRFVHVLRDGRDAALGGNQLQFMWCTPVERSSWRNLQTIHRRPGPCSQILRELPPLSKHEMRRRFPGLDLVPTARAGLAFWSKFNTELFEYAREQLGPSRYIVVRTEDFILGSPEARSACIERFRRFLLGPATRPDRTESLRIFNAHGGRYGGGKYSEAQRAAYNELFREGDLSALARFGYRTDTWGSAVNCTELDAWLASYN